MKTVDVMVVINLREHFIIKLFYHQTIAIIKVEHCCP
jgi:hypothetical protein